MVLLALFASAALLGMTGITLANLVLFPRLAHPVSRLERWLIQERDLYFRGRRGQDGPVQRTGLVSVLVPARNEAPVISGTVARLLAQDYPCFELIVLDDHSTDGTGDLARAAGHGDARLRVISGADLPRGWAGNAAPWVAFVNSRRGAARGDLLVFHRCRHVWSLRRPVRGRGRADPHGCGPADSLADAGDGKLAGTPGGSADGAGRRGVSARLPDALCAVDPVRRGDRAVFDLRRAAHNAIGGHAAIRGEVLETAVCAAHQGPRSGARLRHGRRRRSGRQAHVHRLAVRPRRYAKNILAGYGTSLFFMGLATLFHWLVFLFPPVWLLASGRRRR